MELIEVLTVGRLAAKAGIVRKPRSVSGVEREKNAYGGMSMLHESLLLLRWMRRQTPDKYICTTHTFFSSFHTPLYLLQA